MNSRNVVSIIAIITVLIIFVGVWVLNNHQILYCKDHLWDYVEMDGVVYCIDDELKLIKP